VTAGHSALGALIGALRADKSPRARRTQPAAAGGRSSLGASHADSARRHSTALWIAGGVLVALLLRSPWFDAALGRDEGGVAMVARAWSHSGPYTYGNLFLDRPPLLVELYRVFGAHGDAGIRVLGALAAALLVVTSTLLAVRLAGRAAAPWAAAVAALLASSFALKSVFTPAELLAAVPSSASMLLLVIALERRSRRLWLYAGAGALGAIALLVKQSFGDALAAGAVAVLAGKLTGVSWRETGRRAAAYGAGVGVVAAALVAWAAASSTSAASVYYAMFGFRLDAVHALSKDGFGARIGRLGLPVLESGLAVALVVAVVGIARMRGRPVVRAALGAWLLASTAGVLLGGSYWPHYLIALVSVAAAGAAAAAVRHRWVATAGVCAMAAAAAAVTGPIVLHDAPDSFQQDAITVGHYLRARAEPGQSAYVLYAKVNILYYSGLRAAFPYNWSLMMRAAPHAERTLRRVLASQARPTWIVEQQRTRAFRLDRNGATGRLLTRNYRRVTTLCGHPLFLARGAPARPPPPRLRGPHRCSGPNTGPDVS
jgi:4-amino-4-deoxy-L-arabinose transferase-like glycosyltransferase